MAVTITVASFQTACAECGDAINGEDWGTATKKYAVAEAINAGLELSVSDSGSQISRRQSLEGLKKAIEAARQMVSQTSGTSRFISTRTRHLP